MFSRFKSFIIILVSFTFLSCPEGTGGASVAETSSDSVPTTNTKTMSDGISFVQVPAGSFQKNASESITVSGFYMSEAEITQQQFVSVTGLENPSRFKDGAHPVEQVSFYHALVFCNIYSYKKNKRPVYKIKNSTNFQDWGPIPTSEDSDWNAVVIDDLAEGYRLPKQDEYRWAAMGATQGHGYQDPSYPFFTGYSKVFAGSNNANLVTNFAWFIDNSDQKTQPVKTKNPNELGLYDLSGNVAEWTCDLNNDGKRIVLGSSYLGSSRLLKIDFQGAFFPNSSIQPHIGFRVVYTLDNSLAVV